MESSQFYISNAFASGIYLLGEHAQGAVSIYDLYGIDSNA